MKIKALLIAGATAAVVAAPFAAKAADSATASASATVSAPLTISKTTDLSFGTFAATNVAGTVTVSNTGTRTSSNVDLLSGGTTSAASFAIAGQSNASYSISIPASATLTSGANSMTATLTNNAPGSPALNGSGQATVGVGASLAVGASQAAGSYNGSFTVTVAYN